MKAIPHSEKPFSENFLGKGAAILCACGFLVFPPAQADSVMAMPGGGENIMVTFDELDPGLSLPLTYRGVTYKLLEGWASMIWINPDMPITRHVKSPMLAMTALDDAPGEPANPISLQLDFHQPTPFFGFGLGFNNLTQVPDGSLLPDIGSVMLEFSNNTNEIFPLSATRVLCCTETRFDYSDTDDGVTGNGLVGSAIITLDYNYLPFSPGTGYPGQEFAWKFMGIDDVTYATAGNSAVPVPAAVWLFGSGLIGLVGLARRQQS